MRIGLLAWDAEEWESHSLYRFGQEQGHEMTLFTLGDVGLRLSPSGPEVTVLGESAHDRFDLVLARPELRPGFFEADYELYQMLSRIPGMTVIDPPADYLASYSKLIMFQRLAAGGFPVVPTRSCRSHQDAADAFRQWHRIVLKPTCEGAGTDVERIFDLDRDAPVIERLLARYHVLVCQPYIEHPQGDVRVTVVGDELPLSLRRIPAGGERWKANVAQGAAVEIIPTPPELAELALAAARFCRITIAGLDFLHTAEGYRILEINNAPGWHPLPQSAEQAGTESVFRLLETRFETRARDRVLVP
jgi:ribosomal protein S6--L-glutamate ligase